MNENNVTNPETNISKVTYRTKKKAGDDVFNNYPEKVSIPTFKPYQNALSLLPEGNAYLQPSINVENLKFQEGKLFFEDPTGVMRKISEVELITNFKTKEPIANINGLPLLRAYYSIILQNYLQAIKRHDPLPKVATLYLPNLLKCFGYSGELNDNIIRSIVGQMSSFRNVIGVMKIMRNGKTDYSYYPIFHFGGYDAETNTIELYSPYLNKVVDTMYKEAIKLNQRTKQPILDKYGELIHLPSNSYLIKPSIVLERNLAAVEFVCIIVQVIEQAGDNTPHIKASTLIYRNPQFKVRLNETDSRHKSRLLQRVFKKTWELLREQTDLLTTYKNIQLPDPNNPANIPTMRTLDMVFRFPHEGKIKK